jgi:hypothetical protein
MITTRELRYLWFGTAVIFLAFDWGTAYWLIVALWITAGALID